jgi:hypothetical protein
VTAPEAVTTEVIMGPQRADEGGRETEGPPRAPETETPKPPPKPEQDHPEERERQERGNRGPEEEPGFGQGG